MLSPLLALDIGFKRTGVALSESGIIAQPLGVIEAKVPHMTNVIDEVLLLIKEYDICTLVIGVPYGAEDEMTDQALRVENIITQIEDRITALQPTSLEIVRVNEYASTQDAAGQYPGAERDAAAAALILQDYIDQNA